MTRKIDQCSEPGCKREIYANKRCAQHWGEELKEHFREIENMHRIEKEGMLQTIVNERRDYENVISNLKDELANKPGTIPSEAEVWVRAYCAVASCPNSDRAACPKWGRYAVEDYKKWRTKDDTHN